MKPIITIDNSALFLTIEMPPIFSVLTLNRTQAMALLEALREALPQMAVKIDP
jgi:hypothetical protein